jgi:hypothetical protein
LRSLHINAGIAQAPDMVLPGRQDGALATIGAITDEREQRVIFRLWRGEEGTDMSVLAQH